MENKNIDITNSFYELHKSIMKQIIDWCIENNLSADYISLDADGVWYSIMTGDWNAGTDSSFALFDSDKKCLVCSM
jgi:hypothetical protein